MRLKVLEQAESKVYKVAKLGVGKESALAPLEYRRDFFGKYFGGCIVRALTGVKEWRHGEAELFAAYISKRNECFH